MNPLLVGAGAAVLALAVVSLVFYVIMRFVTREPRYYHTSGERPTRSGRGGSHGSHTASSSSSPTDVSAYEVAIGYHHFTHDSSKPADDHAPHHYTPEAPSTSYGGDVGSVDSTSYSSDGGGSSSSCGGSSSSCGGGGGD
jgi:hypothetical protein